MKPKRRVFVVGGAHTPFIGKFHPDFIWKRHPDFGKRTNPSLEDYLTNATLAAFEATGVAAEAIDKGVVGNFSGELFSKQGHLGSMLARADKGLAYKPLHRVEGACASGGLAVLSAVESLQAGHDVVLAVGAEVQTTVGAREGADFLARAAHYEEERGIDEFTFPCMFARRAKIYKEATGTTDEDIANVVVKAYANGNKNPNAHMRTVTMTLEHAASASPKNPHFLANEEFRAHLKISDCSQVSDGGSAAILATEDGLKRLGISPDDCIELVGYGHATGPLGQVDDYAELGTTRRAAASMYGDVGFGPGDVQVAEVHDCFAVTELLMMEALGFADKGGAADLVREGVTQIEGGTPINTGGGLLSFGHPVGASGVKQVVEIHRQMTGQCGDYQITELPTVGVTANMGGDDRTSVVMGFRKG